MLLHPCLVSTIVAALSLTPANLIIVVLGPPANIKSKLESIPGFNVLHYAIDVAHDMSYTWSC